MNQEVRTRFAPSPTGFMHLGGLRAALYGYLFARKNGGKFILRIEDTDQVRFVEGATEVIYDTLRRCGMNWDEGPDVGGPVGPYIQSQRKDLYLPYAQQLVKTGHAYYCFCTKEELEERRAACEAKGEVFKYDKHCLHLTQEEIQRKLDAGVPYVIRQNAPTTGETSYDDLVFGHMTFPNDTLDDMVLIKQDGMPTYNFANVIDDHLMGITHVMRGMEYLSSTPKYNLLYEAFGWEIPQYIHMPPVMRDSQHKLSKRDGDAWTGFESWSFGAIAQEPERFERAMRDMCEATPEQCRSGEGAHLHEKAPEPLAQRAASAREASRAHAGQEARAPMARERAVGAE